MGTGKRSPLGLPVSDKPPKEVVEGQTGSSRPQSGRAKHMTSRSPQGRSGSSWDTMSPAGCLRAGSRCTNTAPGKAATFSWAQWEIRPLQVRAAGSGNSHVQRSPGPESPLSSKFAFAVICRNILTAHTPSPTHRGALAAQGVPESQIQCSGVSRWAGSACLSSEVSQAAWVLTFFPAPLALLSGSARFLVCLSGIDFNPREQSHRGTGAKTPTAWPGWPPHLPSCKDFSDTPFPGCRGSEAT